MPECHVCGGNEFDLLDGLFYCTECNTQTQEIREEEEEDEYRENIISSLQIKVSKKAKKKSIDVGKPWITTEAFNIILCRQVEALVHLGASPVLKKVVLHLWTKYLQKCDIAFSCKDDQHWQPKLGSTPYQRDVHVVGSGTTENLRRKHRHLPKRVKLLNMVGHQVSVVIKARSRKKCKTCAKKQSLRKQQSSTVKNELSDASVSGSETVPDSTEESSDEQPKVGEKKVKKPSKAMYSSYAKTLFQKYGKKNVGKRNLVATSVDKISLVKLITLCYLGLSLTNDQILLSDVIRWITEGRVPFLDASHCLPSWMKLQAADSFIFSSKFLPKMEVIAVTGSKLATFLGIQQLPARPLGPVILRLILDMDLPVQLLSFIQTIIPHSVMHVEWDVTLEQKPCDKQGLPLIDLKAVAVLLVALKLLFGLDGVLERHVDTFGKKIATLLPNGEQPFIFEDWKACLQHRWALIHAKHVPSCPMQTLDVIDIDHIASYFEDTAYRWHSKETVPVHYKKCLGQQLEFRKSLSKTFCITDSKPAHPNCFSGSFPWITLYNSLRKDLNILSSDVSGEAPRFSNHSITYIVEPDKLRSTKTGWSPAQANWQCDTPTKTLPEVLIIDKEGEDSMLELLDNPPQPWTKYWIKHSKMTRTCSDLQLPSSFMWVLELFSQRVECPKGTVYKEVVYLERLLFDSCFKPPYIYRTIRR